MIDWQDLHHFDLSISRLYASLQLCCAVFVVEQNCPHWDIDGDGLGGENRHTLGWRSGILVAYVRILRGDDELQPVVIGRVIVSEALHGEKTGQQLMSKTLESRTRRWPEKPIYLGAQTHLQSFYGQFSPIPAADIYEEDGIPHIGMARGVIQAQSIILIYGQ